MSRTLTFREALREGLDEELARDPNVVIMGEEVAQYNGAYKVTEGLWKKWGDKRVVDTPISEAGFIGMGIGASMLGVRPVMELMFWSFHSVAFDQLVNNAACVRYMSGGLINCPIVMRGPANGGTNVGATHSHIPEGLFAAFPGLKVCAPATPADAKGLIKAAIRDNDPVYFMENTLLYGTTGEVPDPAEGDFVIPLGVADLKREGKDVSIISHGRSVIHALQAAETLKEQHGIEADVLDLRSIRPLDVEAILKTVKKTNRVVLVDESKGFGGVSAMVSHLIQDEAFDYLDSPIKRVTTLDAPAIYSPHIENEQLPNPRRIVEKVLSLR
ncbi:alpha-ketoacid dehydrogenase subunit beta [Luteolibacter sp. GHJ8]|uniref:Alpha-ketoacid dehydrogenase subunit beta n=1 Tax=Luteolibacter rhizosphaerae TaxID=2989719 RepID=A0ABT3G0E3_9BACT|nr:alpha-ketoacid dehydrogenase subunit beta [Luteolibacter rhizosphaerae]MCW1913313.1 alpha-ketoacid dehydrogenase subunit beta [Luteolibacter rhizosphaerae]